MDAILLSSQNQRLDVINTERIRTSLFYNLHSRFSILVEEYYQVTLCNGGFRGGTAGTNPCFPPPPPFCIRMPNNKAQIARKSIKTPRASRALWRALDPGYKGLRASSSWCVCRHIISCAPPPPNQYPGSAPANVAVPRSLAERLYKNITLGNCKHRVIKRWTKWKNTHNYLNRHY